MPNSGSHAELWFHIVWLRLCLQDWITVESVEWAIVCCLFTLGAVHKNKSRKRQRVERDLYTKPARGGGRLDKRNDKLRNSAFEMWWNRVAVTVCDSFFLTKSIGTHYKLIFLTPSSQTQNVFFNFIINKEPVISLTKLLKTGQE